MLEYKISPVTNYKTKPINIISLEMSENMSKLSGVTYASEHIDTLETLGFYNSETSIDVKDCEFAYENHQRQGILLVEGDRYEVQTISTSANSIVNNTIDSEISYIEFQNQYYYVYEQNKTKRVRIPDFISSNGEVSSAFTEYLISDNSVTLSYSLWIDDSKVNYKGVSLIVDTDYKDNNGHSFALRYNETSDPLFASDLGVSSLSVKLFKEDITNILPYDVTYFTLSNDTEDIYNFNQITCGSYGLFVDYDSNMYKCTNIGTMQEPIWGNSGITMETDDDYQYISALCYIYSASTSSETQVAGSSFIDYGSNNIYEEYNDVWCYLSNDKHTVKTKYPVHYELQNSNYGQYLLVYADEGYMKGVGTKFIFRDTSVSQYIDINYGITSDKDFIIYNNRKYFRKEHLCDQVSINDELFDITYNDLTQIGKNSIVDVDIHGTLIQMYSIAENKLELRDTQVLTSLNTLEYPTYIVTQRDGVRIGGQNHPIIEPESSASGHTAYVEISEPKEYEMIVTEVYGTNIMVMTPLLHFPSNSEFSLSFLNQLRINICTEIVNNSNEFTLYYPNYLFGNHILEEGLGYISSGMPSSTFEYYHLKDSITIYGREPYFSIEVPLNSKPANNILLDNIQYDQFYKVNKERLINKYVEMEKDVYCPMYPETKDGKVVFSNGFPKMLPVYEIQTNLHFRTRNLDNWKVIEESEDKEHCHWFITDYYPYKNNLSNKEIQNLSDLVGFLNFTHNDVFYQKKRLEKSFLRFSVYDSPDPQTQTLLNTSTVWMDETYLYKKFISNNKRFDNLIFKNVDDKENPTVSGHSVDVLNEPFLIPANGASDFTYVDENRLSSRFTITNKYESDASSEGFYLYIYKEYSKNLRPVPLYMTVEFNHAGIGQKIPFIIPMKWNSTGKTAIPTERCTLNELAKHDGYALDDVYMQTYIPLYCAYDKINHQYFYYFDDRYVTNNNGTVILNLFELKIAGESVPSINTNHNFVLSDTEVLDKLTGVINRNTN